MSNKSDVYFFKLDEIGKLKVFLDGLPRSVGVKAHFGEPGNTAYVKADKIKKLCALLKEPTLIETTVLYKSQRRTASGHKQVALDHGFDFAPIDIIDGEDGDEVKKVVINKEHFTECSIGAGIDRYGSLLIVSHFKGHGIAGFGGAIKNLGMGLASREGKLQQHSSVQHIVNAEKCISCGICIDECPVKAISFVDSIANIDKNICISCSKCIAHCPVEAIEIPWMSTASKDVRERIAEYAFASTRDKNSFYINFLTDIVEDCDCVGEDLERLTGDIGVLASADPVAVDQASYDIVTAECPAFKRLDGRAQIDHGEKIGLGNSGYNLINK